MMNKDMVQHSLLRLSHIKKSVCHFFDFPTSIHIRLLNIGCNDIYYISHNKQEFTLRLYRNNWRQKKDILNEIELLTLFSYNKINVNIPLKNNTGDYIGKVFSPEGDRLMLLYEYFNGWALTINASLFYTKIGQELALLHSISIPSHFNYGKRRYLCEVILANAYSVKNNFEMEYDATIEFKYILDKIGAYFEKNSSNLEVGFCHGDFHNDNVLINKNSKPKLIDFDLYGFGYQLYDLATLIYVTWKMWNVATAKQKIISGYSKYKKLSDYEINTLPWLGLLRWAWNISFFSENFHQIPVWKKDFLANNILLAKKWIKINNL